MGWIFIPCFKEDFEKVKAAKSIIKPEKGPKKTRRINGLVTTKQFAGWSFLFFFGWVT